jgi:predicted dehydrogenase
VSKRFGVGIVGMTAGVTWASSAHLPALRHLHEDYRVIGLANTSHESALAAAEATGIEVAFRSVDELVACPDVDVVTVTVRVPHHFAIVSAALSAGKHVYCEWPLGNGLEEAIELGDMARSAGRLGVVGTQAMVAPEIEHVRDLVSGGYVGEVLSTSLIGSGWQWGPVVNVRNRYLLDHANGANMLTIPVGHTLAAVQRIFGPIQSVSALCDRRRASVEVVETGEQAPLRTADQIMVTGKFASGVPMSLHYRGGTPRGPGLLWEIHGTEGDIVIEAASGHSQMTQLSVKGARGSEQELAPLALPASDQAWPKDVVPRNVAIVYGRMADDLRNDTRTAPSFDDAIQLHRVIAAIEQSSETGQWMAAG